MKHIFLVAIIIGLAFLTKAQKEYEVSTDGTNKILKGLISRDMLEQDTAFNWFRDSETAYHPVAEDIAILKAKRQQVQFLVFGGTWSEDTKQLLPKFFSLMDAAAISQDQVTLIGVDHAKKTVNHLSEEMHITKIPTVILLKNGQEMGRIVDFVRKDDPWRQQITDILISKF